MKRKKWLKKFKKDAVQKNSQVILIDIEIWFSKKKKYEDQKYYDILPWAHDFINKGIHIKNNIIWNI